MYRLYTLLCVLSVVILLVPDAQAANEVRVLESAVPPACLAEIVGHQAEIDDVNADRCQTLDAVFATITGATCASLPMQDPGYYRAYRRSICIEAGRVGCPDAYQCDVVAFMS